MGITFRCDGVLWLGRVSGIVGGGGGTAVPYTQGESMATHLDTILAKTRATVAAAKALVPAAELERRASAHQPRGWAAALRRRAAVGPAVIAEIKKASPSKGLIREDFNVEWLARRCQAGGAGALSVLTDEPFFQGSLRNLELASKAVKLPCLRKDFMVDEYQIVEARAHRADAVLLIAAALSNAEMQRFSELARVLKLDVLVEVHTGEELDRVLDAVGAVGADAIGVNNRDLKTFAVRLETSLELAGRIPAGVVRVAESGIATGDDLAGLRAAGFDAFLIGESLMRQADPGAALKELLDGTRERPSFNKVLASMPNVGKDSDFERKSGPGRASWADGKSWIDE